MWYETYVKPAFHSHFRLLRHLECLGRILGEKIWQPTRLMKICSLVIDIMQLYYGMQLLPIVSKIPNNISSRISYLEITYLNNRMISETFQNIPFLKDSHNNPLWKWLTPETNMVNEATKTHPQLSVCRSISQGSVPWLKLWEHYSHHFSFCISIYLLLIFSDLHYPYKIAP